ncbi:ABC transporter ATP-binding protein [Gynuella sp.]|uniref:ABC transporter ATP-binding protein n=1 Tax=Gynuella sp. TaxID=2969146 RepID=UPI003D0F6246
MPIIEVEKLTRRYAGLVAVDAVSFTIEEGVCFGLLGPNGAGKTTTIEMMEGISAPTSGTIRYFGERASKKMYQRIGIQFQNTALPDYLTVRETLDLFASFYQRRLSIAELMELCQLESFVDRDTRLLSGGQRQRMLLALALVNDPAIIFLDEPSTGLDPQARFHFWQLIQTIKARGKTIILTTHYMDEAQFLCDEIVIMDEGRIVEAGTPEALLNRYFNGVYIQVPKHQCDADVMTGLGAAARNGCYEILTDHLELTLQQLISSGVPLQDLQVKSPNLEDLFLRLTGHELRV